MIMRHWPVIIPLGTSMIGLQWTASLSSPTRGSTHPTLSYLVCNVVLYYLMIRQGQRVVSSDRKQG